MSKESAVKEKIGFYKLLFSICVAILISIGSWLINHIEKYHTYRYIIGCITLVIVFMICIKFFKKINNYIQKLEEL